MFNKIITKMVKKTITSEYVSFGHPDKIADQISDVILDAYLRKDDMVRAGIEVMVKDNIVILGGEVSSDEVINYDQVVRPVFATLNFSKEHYLEPNKIKIINLIGKQSPEIHQGVDKGDNIGAGDQGFMVGYASSETPTYMPLGVYIAKTICDYISTVHHKFGPDTKTQVVVEYENNVASIKSILVSTMNQIPLDNTRKLISNMIKYNMVNIDDKIYQTYIKDKNFPIIVNPCGSWSIGGPVADCGVTGRKLVVDQYGGYCNIGGGALSGKDMSKVDRSGAYMARYLAKNIVASGICHNAKVELSYGIGISEPLSINVEIDINQHLVPNIIEWIKNNVDLSPKGIIKRFNGSYPRNYYLAKHGHYGVDVSNDSSLEKIYPWEKTDISEYILKLL